jgi:single-strand DNA-binding protein
MANDINRVYLIGRLTRDPELRYTQGGTSIANFSVANNRTYTVQNERKESVSYFNCVAWGKPGEVIAQYLKKGQRIALEGRLQQRSWQDKDGQKRNSVEIVVENFQFIDAKGKEGAESTSPNAPEDSYAPPSTGFDQQFQESSAQHFSDDDIPF